MGDKMRQLKELMLPYTKKYNSQISLNIQNIYSPLSNIQYTHKRTKSSTNILILC